jgi:hypothetical protein
VHEVRYAMIIILAMGIGLFAPPFGVGFYGACDRGSIARRCVGADVALPRGTGGGIGNRRGSPLVVDRLFLTPEGGAVRR